MSTLQNEEGWSALTAFDGLAVTCLFNLSGVLAASSASAGSDVTQSLWLSIKDEVLSWEMRTILGCCRLGLAYALTLLFCALFFNWAKKRLPPLVLATVQSAILIFVFLVVAEIPLSLNWLNPTLRVWAFVFAIFAIVVFPFGVAWLIVPNKGPRKIALLGIYIMSLVIFL